MDLRIVFYSGILMLNIAGASAFIICNSTEAQICIRQMQAVLDQAYTNMTHFCRVRDDVMSTARTCVTDSLKECHINTLRQINDSLNHHIVGYMRDFANCYRVQAPCGREDLEKRAAQIKDCFMDVIDKGTHQDICSSIKEAGRCAHSYAKGCNTSVAFCQQRLDEYRRTNMCGAYASTTQTPTATSAASSIDTLIQRLRSRCVGETTSSVSDETGAETADPSSTVETADEAEISQSETAMAVKKNGANKANIFLVGKTEAWTLAFGTVVTVFLLIRC